MGLKIQGNVEPYLSHNRVLSVLLLCECTIDNKNEQLFGINGIHSDGEMGLVCDVFWRCTRAELDAD